MKSDLQALLTRPIKTFALIAVFLLVSLASGAQSLLWYKGKGTPDDKAKRITQMMSDKLSLSASQETTVSVLMSNYSKKMNDAAHILDTRERQKEVDKLDSKLNGDLKKVLSANQYTNYQKALKDYEKRQLRKKKK